MERGFHHTPVMVDEVLEGLRVRPGGRYVDATVGEGGHSQAILEACTPGGAVLGIDADASALQVASDRFKAYGSSFRAEAGNFSHIDEICHRTGFHPVEGILFDLGLSSRQLDDGSRGFSFQREGPLDMRFDVDQVLTADDIVNTWPEEELAQGLRDYGQEPRSRRIASAIVAGRPIGSTLDLADLIAGAVRGSRRRLHPATRTFQALRILVNQELDSLKRALGLVVGLIGSGGRLAVITYHSLEASIFKTFLRLEARGCICPIETLVCVCEHSPTIRRVNKKAIGPGDVELEANPRSRSARLRIGERI